MEQSNIKIFFRTLSGAYGFDSACALVHEIGKAVMPLIMKMAALVFAFQALQDVEPALFALAVGTYLLGSGFQWFFDTEHNAIIKLPVNELFTQHVDRAGGTPLTFVHSVRRARIDVMVDQQRVFTLGECGSEHLVDDYLAYILSDQICSTRSKMSGYHRTSTIHHRDGDTLTEVRFFPGKLSV